VGVLISLVQKRCHKKSTLKLTMLFGLDISYPQIEFTFTIPGSMTYVFQAPEFYKKMGFEVEHVRKSSDEKLTKYFLIKHINYIRD